MSMFTHKMKMLTAIVLDSKSEVVIKKLLELGVMDFVSLDSVHPDKSDKLMTHNPFISETELFDLQARIETYYNQAELSYPVLSTEDVESNNQLGNIDDIKRSLDKLASSMLSLKDRQQLSNQKLIICEELLSYINKKKTEFLDTRVGNITRGDISSLSQRISQINGIMVNVKDDIAILTLKRDAAFLSPILDKFGWVETDAVENQRSAMPAFVKELQSRIISQNNTMKELRLEIRKQIVANKELLDKDYVSIRLSQLYQKMQSYFSYTDHTTLFSGWIPYSMMGEVEKAIKDASNDSCIIEWTGDDEVKREEVPVYIDSPKYLKPFRKLVDNYNTPEYGSINPVPFTAVAYFLMFALMFADLGQGFVLLLIGILGNQYYKKHPLEKDGLISRYLCSLLLYLGPASMLGGILFGSFFGYSVFPAIWFNYHKVVMGDAHTGLVTSIFDLLGITIKFGIAIIYTGLLLNWINLFFKKRYLELIFDKNGLVGGLLYGCGIAIGFSFVSSGYKDLALTPVLSVLLLIGIILLVIKGPTYSIYNYIKNKEKESIGKIIMDSIIDLLLDVLEIFSGFLSNTLSFMRIAGLGIAHVALMVAFEDMAMLTGNLFFEIIIMIIGNLMVLMLEGLSAGIQALRLNYYEFFTKYFTGSGVVYSPLNLDTRIKIKN